MPKEKKKAYLINLIGILLIFALLVILLDTPLLGRQVNYISGIATMAMITIVMVCSLNLITGFMGEFSLGHAGFMSIGAYTSAMVTIAIGEAGISLPNGLLFLIAIAVGGISAAFMGFLVGVPALRLKGDYLAIVTIAFAEIVRVAWTNIPAAGGGKTLSGIAKVSDFHLVFWVMVISVTVMYMFVRSRYGRIVKAIREDDIAAAASGINVTYYKVLTFTISAFFAGIGGAMYSHYLTSLISTKFSFMYSAEFLTMVILGGTGSLTGSVVGAAILASLPEVLRSFQSYRMLMYSIVLVLVMIFKPGGLFGTYEFSLTKLLLRLKNGKPDVKKKEALKGGVVHD